jgi:hypothetical protein
VGRAKKKHFWVVVVVGLIVVALGGEEEEEETIFTQIKENKRLEKKLSIASSKKELCRPRRMVHSDPLPEKKKHAGLV